MALTHELRRLSQGKAHRADHAMAIAAYVPLFRVGFPISFALVVLITLVEADLLGTLAGTSLLGPLAVGVSMLVATLTTTERWRRWLEPSLLLVVATVTLDTVSAAAYHQNPDLRLGLGQAAAAAFAAVLIPTRRAAFGAAAVMLVVPAVAVPLLWDAPLTGEGWFFVLLGATTVAVLGHLLDYVRLGLLHAWRTADHMADHDLLTGLANRRAFIQQANERRALTQAPGTRSAFLFLDIDHFKAVNDQLGHGAGDTALVSVAEALADAVGGRGALGRLGGEEFAVYVAPCGIGQARVLAERLRQAVRCGPSPWGPGRPLTVSIGVAVGVGDGLEVLMREADLALYAAKNAGRDRVMLSDLCGSTPPPDEVTQTRLMLPTRSAHAVTTPPSDLGSTLGRSQLMRGV